jgi:hypothetical protein
MEESRREDFDTEETEDCKRARRTDGFGGGSATSAVDAAPCSREKSTAEVAESRRVGRGGIWWSYYRGRKMLQYESVLRRVIGDRSSVSPTLCDHCG